MGQEVSRCGERQSVRYLDGVAVDGLSSAGHVHRFGDLQDVVWHVACCTAAVTNLPPLLPVVQHLPGKSQGLLHSVSPSSSLPAAYFLFP